MRKFYFLFVIPLIYINACTSTVKKANETDFNGFITCVRDGDNACLKVLPDNVRGLNFEQSIMLRDALVNSLIKSPESTIDALNRIDKETAKTGHSFVKDNYGSDIVCAYMIDSNRYDRRSFFKYYFIAKSKIEKTGAKGKSCLEIMNSSVEETLQEEKLGKMKWGNETYPF